MKNLAMFCALCLSALAIMGCGRRGRERAAEKALEKETGESAKVELSQNRMSVRMGDGETAWQAGEKVALPEDFPADLHLPKGAQIHMAMKTPDGFMVALRTEDAEAKVQEAYRKEMARQGWKEEQTVNMGGTTMLLFEKDRRNAQITLAVQDGQTHVSLVASR